MSKYRVGSPFVTRLAGIPADIASSLGTPRSLAAARAASAAAAALERAGSELSAAVKRSSMEHANREKVWQAIVKRQRVPDLTCPSSISAVLERYQAAVADNERLHAEADATAASDFEQAARKLLEHGQRYLPEYAPFAREGMLNALGQLRGYIEAGEVSTYDGRRSVRTVAHYVNRLAVKNETVSAYGPTVWGRVDRSLSGFKFDARPGVARATHFYERWVVKALVRAINDDAGTRIESAPRLNRNCQNEKGTMIVLDTGAKHVLDDRQQAVLARCDGQTCAHLFAVPDLDILESLARNGLIVWELELPDLEPHALEVLADDIAAWRDGAAKQRWSRVIGALADLKKQFADRHANRLELIDRALLVLHEVGVDPPSATRTLYVGANVFGEECIRDATVVVGGDLATQLAVDAAPYYDMWQDMHAYVSNEVARQLLEIVDLERPMPLPTYLARCAAAGCDLRRDTLPRLAGKMFLQMKQAWTKYLANRAPDAPRWQLGDDELAFMRQTFPAARVRDCSYPSIDAQICMKENGDYELLLSELHMSLAPVNYCIGWGCGDLPALVESCRRTSGGVPVGYYGQMGPRLTAHTTIQFARYYPDTFVYCANERAAPSWRVVPPSRVEVHRIEEGPDIRLRGLDGEDLGSVSRTWATGGGMHPFTFAWGPHSPRLYVGRVIVQRETWNLSSNELPKTPTLAAIDALRGAKGWPRYIFTRPADTALKRPGNTGLDKDVKPFFVDLESLIGIDALVHQLRKYGEIEIAEMLPTIEESAWVEGAQRYSFELRMLVEPDA